MVVFDLDGTLVDTAPDLLEQLERVMTNRGLEISSDINQYLIGGGARKLIERSFETANRTLTEQELTKIEDDFIHHYKQHCTRLSRPFPNTISVLEELAAAGVQMSVCTNKRQDLAEKVLTELSLAHFFNPIIGRQADRPAKPEASALKPITRQAGYDGKQMIMVGDSSTDIAFARACGMKVIGVSFGYSAEPIHTLGADAVINHWRELPQKLRKLW